jgi:glycosyltransferase involved in cell wall biosynthesis
MKVSCIIPAFNEEKSIDRVLGAVLSVAEISEIIVVDDCSTDKTKDIVEAFSGVTLLRNKKIGEKAEVLPRG